MNGEDIHFFRTRVVAYARTLPLSDAMRFLRGALEVAGEHPEMLDVRSAYQALHVGDAQLELIAGAQMKLNLGDGQ